MFVANALTLLFTANMSVALTVTVLALTLILSLALCGKDKAVKLATEEISLLLQVFNSFLQPRIFLQRDLQLSP